MKKKLFGLIIITMLVFVFSSLFGAMNFSIKDIFTNEETKNLWLNMRMPRCILGFIVGSVLSLGGMSFQAIFKNPLAEPWTLGVSSGATLGCVLCITLGLTGLFFGWGMIFFAFIFGLLSIFLVYFLTKIKKNFATSDMLLAGIGVNFFFSALILFCQYLGNEYNLTRIIHWTMGGVDIIGYDKILIILPFYVVGIFFVVRNTRELNLLSCGEDIAVSRGVNVSKVKKIIFFSVSLMVGAVCAVCGPIGFVGMICPHIMRLVFGYDNRKLALVCPLFGGGFLVLCDALARSVLAPLELPVGIITALLGGPFFVYLLLRK